MRSAHKRTICGPAFPKKRSFAHFGFWGFSLFAALPANGYCGAWVQPVDEIYLDQRLSLYRSDHFYDADGQSHPQPTYQKLESGTYLEYGLLEELSVGGSIMLDEVRQPHATGTSESDENHVVSDPEIFAKYAFWQSPSLTLSFQPLLKLPRHSQKEHAPQSGSNGFDEELSLLAGYVFEWNQQWHYVDARLGYRSRQGQGLSDQLRADVTIGYHFTPQWLATTSLYTVWATSTAQEASFSESADQDYDLMKMEAMLHYQLTDSERLYAGTFYHVAGNNTGAGLGFLIGTAYRLSP